MAREIKRLSVLSIRAMKKSGRYADGGGLYFYISKTGSRSWVFRYRDRLTSKLRDKGLGPFPDITLEMARERAVECRRALLDGKDPIDSSRQAKDSERLDKARRLSFGDCADKYIAAHKAGWRNAKHGGQWRSTLDTYAAELLPLPVGEIDTAIVLKSIEPIWNTKTETATRVRQRIEAVLDWATARGYRSGENPARWRGHLQKLLPAPAKLKDVKHRPALPYTAVGPFMATLGESEGLAAKALALQVLTATRPGEAVGARWSEFDLEEGVWTIPKGRMKAHREHRVPLAPALVKLLRALPRDPGGFLFPGKPKRSITTAAMLKQLQAIEPGLTSHGFRSTFRDWAADQTSYSRDVVEEALAHVLKDKTEAAYRRTDLMEKRARLMADWAKHCANTKPKGTNITPIRGQKSA